LDFYHRSGGGAGGGGQIFILASQSKIVWWKTDIKTTFKDVAGLEEQRRNTRNCWIKNPEKIPI
jgi:cell division protease FtsH